MDSNPTKNKRALGAAYEQKAADYLAKRGVTILERNFRSRGGEIDIVAKDGNAVIFVEVKYRQDLAAGHPAEAVTYSKQRTICRTADFYRMKNGLSEDRPYRFDVIAILGDQIIWYRNAFEYIR